MDKYFYQDAANHIRKNYDSIVNRVIFDRNFVSGQEEYLISFPQYNLAAHYTFEVMRTSSGKCIARGEVSAKFVEEKKVRFYHGYKVLYEEIL